MDAIYGTGINTGGVLYPNTGLSNNVSHSHLLLSHYAFPDEDSTSAVRVRLLTYASGD
jgi:hypothetical protein